MTTQSECVAQLANLLSVDEPVTPARVYEAAEAAILGAGRAKKALETAAQGLDNAAAELLKRRGRANSNQAYADMTDVSATLVNTAADARNVAAVL